ncbi:MAG: hypothetical protein AB1421_12420 [Pseudomonadota bacterium]
MAWFRASCVLLGIALVFPGAVLPALAAAPAVALTVDAVLSAHPAPPGVVFEIADRDGAALKRALPWVAEAAARLRERHPNLSMAVVSHGREMFAFQESARAENPEVHDLARQLGQGQGIPIHVCETHAGWRGVMPEDFPGYIDVAPTGPAQVRSYLELGYVLVKVPRNIVPAKPPGR